MPPVTITFVLSSKGRPESLTSTVENIYEKAYCKRNVSVLCIADGGDQDTIRAAEDLSSRFDNVSLLCIPHDSYPGYLGLCEVWDEGASQVTTDLVAMWGDRGRIHTQGFDTEIGKAHASREHDYMIYQLHEDRTWGFAYPVISTKLNRLVRPFRTEAPDAYIRYLAECCCNNIYVPTCKVSRGDALGRTYWNTPYSVKVEKEKLFRNSQPHKKLLREHVRMILLASGGGEPVHAEHRQWLEGPTIGGGPALLSTKR